MLTVRRSEKSVVSKDETPELEGAARLAAIQRRLEILMRDAREIRGALAKLADRDPFAVLRQTLEERSRRTRPPGD
jgi:hypothetical protein